MYSSPSASTPKEVLPWHPPAPPVEPRMDAPYPCLSDGVDSPPVRVCEHLGARAGEGKRRRFRSIQGRAARRREAPSTDRGWAPISTHSAEGPLPRAQRLTASTERSDAGAELTRSGLGKGALERPSFAVVNFERSDAQTSLQSPGQSPCKRVVNFPGRGWSTSLQTGGQLRVQSSTRRSCTGCCARAFMRSEPLERNCGVTMPRLPPGHKLMLNESPR